MASNQMSQFNQFQSAPPNFQPTQKSWIDDFSTLPLVYKQGHEAVVSPDGSIDTARIYNILLTSQLSREALGRLWTIANKERLGHLTQKELYILLALIAVAQSGQLPTSVDPLLKLASPPIPVFQNVVQPAAQTQNTAAPSPQATPSTAANDDDDFDDFQDFQSVDVSTGAPQGSNLSTPPKAPSSSSPSHSIANRIDVKPDVFLPETKPTQSPAPVAAFSNFKSPNLASSNVNELPAPSGHNGYHPPIDPPTYQELFPNASKTPSSQKTEVPVAANVQDVTIKAALFPPLSDPGKSSLPLSTTSHVEESDDFADFVAAAPSPGASFATDMTSPEDDSWASFQSPVPPVAPTTNLSSNNNDNSSSWGVFQSEPKPTTSGTDAPSFLQPTPAAGDKYAALKDFEMAL